MRRIFAISDLHLGGTNNARPELDAVTPAVEHTSSRDDQYDQVLGHPEILLAFLRRLSSYAETDNKAVEAVELVIHGDVIDFLALSPFQAWTASESEAVNRFKSVVGAFRCVFDELGRCVQYLNRLTILLGNHDIELAYPRVRDEFMKHMGENARACNFIIDNQAYRNGDVLIEHGNRYDPWNAIDHDGLRHVVSCSSRGEDAVAKMHVCPGSLLVRDVINPLKKHYHFIDLLKPENKVVVLLLSALEPSLKYDLPIIFKGAKHYIQEWIRSRPWLAQEGGVPGSSRLLADENAEAQIVQDEQLYDVFKEELQGLSDQGELGFGDSLRRAFLIDRKRLGVRARLEDKREIPPEQLTKLQVALNYALKSDRTFDFDEPDGPYLAAANRIIKSFASPVPRVIVMGHTHLARQISLGNGCTYVNTGTWADLISVPMDILQDNQKGRTALQEWLRELVIVNARNLREPRPTFADISLSDAGSVIERPGIALLRTFSDRQGL
jgi:UDP-2,3-diacylglucosamine pyrophosphatase LpxH